ncbi:MAG TPA: putative porin [Pseudomonadales bacterium]|jgi:hypothetical protein
MIDLSSSFPTARRKPLLSVVSMVLAMLVVPPVQSSEVDLLIEKLVAKGILNEGDAKEIRAEVARERQQAAAAPVEIQDLGTLPVAHAPAEAKEHWSDKISFKGDLRVRYQGEELDNAPSIGPFDIDERNRWRIRWRAGVEADVSDRWEVGFGLASGGSDARSSNQTLRNAFSTGDARLDYAFARFKAGDGVDVVAGKFKNPIWKPKDLLWDSDIRTDGVAVPMEFGVNDRVSAFVTPAYLVLTEDVIGGQDDAAMWLLQAGANFDLSDAVSLTVAPTYYNFVNLKGSKGPITVDVPSNARGEDDRFVYDYDSIALGGKLDIDGTELIPRVSVFGEWVKAFDPDEEDTGWLVGLALGDAKVSNFGDWQLKYNYRRLEADAWPEFLSDSDFFFGATNVKGSEFEFIWGLAKGVNVSVDYYTAAKFIGSDLEQDLLQLDLNVKW